MTELIRLEDIDEFQLVKGFPRTAVTHEMLAGIKNLNETKEIEPFLRSILPDLTETAHGSTEIADVLTTHVTYGGRARHAAFVNKGKSSQKVTSRKYSYQLIELRQLTGLHLMALLAVGDIQDDIKRDLMRLAEDQGCDYLVVDAIDVARLFMAYRKVCPRDGTPYVEGMCSTCGMSVEKPLKLTIDVYEQPTYQILSLSDMSTGVAKRYSANILADRHYSRTTLREVIKEAIWKLRHSDYYRSGITERYFGNQETDYVFLFVYLDREDQQTHNWICRAQWISPDVPEKFRPVPWSGQEKVDDIVLDWKNNYESVRQFFKDRSTKQEWIRKVESVLPEMDQLIANVGAMFQACRERRLPNEEFDRTMMQREAKALDLSRRAENKRLPPIECNDADRSFQQLVATLHNVFVPFAAWSRVKRDWQYKEWHLRTYLSCYDNERRELEYELKKIRR